MQEIEIPKEAALKALRQLLKAERLKHWNAGNPKSDAYRQLERDGKLNAEFFLDEAPKIMAKTSELPAGQRAYITAIMDAAAAKCVRWAQQAEAEAAAKAAAAEAEKIAAAQPVINAPKGGITPKDEEKADAAPAEAADKPEATKVRKSTASNKKPAKSNKTAAKSNKTSQK